MYQLKKEIASLFEQPTSVFSFDSQKEKISTDFQAFQTWLNEKAHAEMKFLENNRDVRQNPNLILSGCQTALIFLFPYAHGFKVRNRLQQNRKIIPVEENSLIGKKLISKYVYGKDYHKIIKKELERKAENLKKFLNTEFQFRPVVDSIPFFDRAHAREAHLGFVGKNTMLIKPGMGSYFFIGSLLTTLPIETLAIPQQKIPAVAHLDCGSCQKCMDSCPTKAIEKDRYLNASKCLSYLTIEHRDIIPESFHPHFKETIYGCDICQDVCPYNAVTLDWPLLPEFSKPHTPFTQINVEQIAQMSRPQYEQWFGGTAATRAKYDGLVRNALLHLSAIKHENLKSICYTALKNDSNLIRQTVFHILKRIDSSS